MIRILSFLLVLLLKNTDTCTTPLSDGYETFLTSLSCTEELVTLDLCGCDGNMDYHCQDGNSENYCVEGDRLGVCEICGSNSCGNCCNEESCLNAGSECAWLGDYQYGNIFSYTVESCINWKEDYVADTCQDIIDNFMIGDEQSLQCPEIQALLAELEEQRSLWSTCETSCYSYSLQVSCFCIKDYIEPKHVNVDGEGARVTLLDGSLATDGSYPAKLTVLELFDYIEELFLQSGSANSVEYDLVCGYPTVINADPIPMAVDDEQFLTIMDMELGDCGSSGENPCVTPPSDGYENFLTSLGCTQDLVTLEFCGCDGNMYYVCQDDNSEQSCVDDDPAVDCETCGFNSCGTCCHEETCLNAGTECAWFGDFQYGDTFSYTVTNCINWKETYAADTCQDIINNFMLGDEQSLQCPEAPVKCEYSGVQYDQGDNFDSNDGCNTCGCTEDGVACTEAYCVLGNGASVRLRLSFLLLLLLILIAFY